MTDQELQLLTEKWSLQYFGRPFLHKIFFNRRLRTTGGRYHLSDHHIDINPLMLSEYDLATLRGVVLHELCHYHLHLLGRGYQHRDRDFRQLLDQVGGSRFAPPTSKLRGSRHRYLYQCQRCGAAIWRRRRFNVARYRCAKCGGPIKLVKAFQA
ncbi:SprT family protein [Limosilactobacillus secaliphilus]|uniref:Protein SprT-like n=1 Tax=Limosilactobacillus secaliphilus TaxID=396268 RepID=A0A0R2I443_9LACO|nr:SprT family protein [Limosilactobacillus secaliphilus]KRN59614.1 hypothetical protein IV45_GL001363 [Limosilactobacillus secaliphilus]